MNQSSPEACVQHGHLDERSERNGNEIRTRPVQTLLPSLFGGVGRTGNRGSNTSPGQGRATSSSALTSQRTTAPKRKRSTSGVVGRAKTWNKDVVCIPESLFEKHSTIAIPRGRTRGELAERDLIGKIRLVSTWSSREVILIYALHQLISGKHQ